MNVQKIHAAQIEIYLNDCYKMKKIQIMIIEDNRLLRDSIVAIIKKQSDMHVNAAIGNEGDISEIIKTHKPNIVLLELGLLNQNSLQIVKKIKEAAQETNIIVMDLIPVRADILEFVQLGVSGFILKDANASELSKTIRQVNEGEQILPHQLTGSLFSQIVEQSSDGTKLSIIDRSVRLTKRENQIILLVSDGLTNKEIAQRLRLSPFTVKSHVHNILEKLALTTRVQIAKYAHTSASMNSTMDDIT
jgi:DNA-binding NarL/FixJ family response regulator